MNDQPTFLTDRLRREFPDSWLCLTSKQASCRVLDKLGMHHEGLLRQYVQKNGTFEDLQLYSLLAESWWGAREAP